VAASSVQVLVPVMLRYFQSNVGLRGGGLRVVTAGLVEHHRPQLVAGEQRRQDEVALLLRGELP
jgi:hypothetical protein